MNSLLSASVITTDCTTADALATAFMVMGEEECEQWLQEHPEVQAYLIIDDGNGGLRTWTSPGLELSEAGSID